MQYLLVRFSVMRSSCVAFMEMQSTLSPLVLLQDRPVPVVEPLLLTGGFVAARGGIDRLAEDEILRIRRGRREAMGGEDGVDRGEAVLPLPGRVDVAVIDLAATPDVGLQECADDIVARIAEARS